MHVIKAISWQPHATSRDPKTALMRRFGVCNAIAWILYLRVVPHPISLQRFPAASLAIASEHNSQGKLARSCMYHICQIQCSDRDTKLYNTAPDPDNRLTVQNLSCTSPSPASFQGRNLTSMSNSKPQALLQVLVPLTVVLTILLVLIHALIRVRARGWRDLLWSDILVRESTLPMHATDVDIWH